MTELRLPGGNKIGFQLTWDMTISTEDRPKVMVVSHERAGTHFLMNTIAYNFSYISDPWIDVDHNSIVNPWAWENMKFFFDQSMGKNVVNTFKSHHPVDFFPDIEYLLEEFVILYIWRKDHDSLFASFCKHLNDFPWHTGPKVETGMELKMAAPCGACTRYQVKAHKTMFHRYHDHIDGWLNRADESDRIHHVQYELLDEHFEREVVHIGRHLGIAAPAPPRRPPRNKSVITPELVAEKARRLGL